MGVNTLSDTDLIMTYGAVIQERKTRGIIRSKNVLGDLGEHLAINHYSQTKGLPRLQMAPPATKNIDAISVNGDRYSIKSTTGSVTSVFYGMNPPDFKGVEQQKFEYVIIVLFDDNYQLKRINELTWGEFLRYRRWHSRMSAWNLGVSKEMLKETRTIFLPDS